MRRRVIALAVCAALGAALLPALALAGGRPHPHRGPSAHRVRHGGVQAVPEFRPKSAFGSPGGFPFTAKPKHHGRFSHRVPHPGFGHGFLAPAVGFSYVPGAVYGSPAEAPSTVVNVAPVVYVSPTVYVAPTVASPEVAPVAPAAPPTRPVPEVVEHPTGRYELRGDGHATPYVWVWIPNPPAAPPAVTSPSADPRSADSAGRTETYRWTDDEGTTFWTNRLDRIPEARRPRTPGPTAGVTPP
jgi:hypothetical protein